MVVGTAVEMGKATKEKAGQMKDAVVGTAVGVATKTSKAVVGIGEKIKSSYAKGKESVLNGIDGIKGGFADGLDHVSAILQEKINSNNTRAAQIRESIASRQKEARRKGIKLIEKSTLRWKELIFLIYFRVKISYTR